MGFMRTNYNIPRGDPATSWIHNLFESTIRWNSCGILSCAGYFVDSLGGYGLPSVMTVRGLSVPGPAASCKGDGQDSTMQWAGFGPGSFSESVFFVTALVLHAGGSWSGAVPTLTIANAVDVYDTATPSTSISAKMLYMAVFGSL